MTAQRNHELTKEQQAVLQMVADELERGSPRRGESTRMSDISRTSGRAKPTLVALLAAVLALAGRGTGVAGEDGAGVWAYKTTYSFAIINLTSYNMKILAYNVTAKGGAEPGGGGWLVFGWQPIAPFGQ
jgi:hypothetical protein